MINLIKVGLLHIVIVRFVDTVVNEKEGQNYTCCYGYGNRHPKNRVLPNQIIVKLVSCVFLYDEAADQAKHADCKLAIYDDIDKGYACCGWQGLADDRHEPNVDDHECSDVADFIVEIRSLDKGKQCEDSNKYQWNEDGE